jgi:hypothetical protein
MAEIRQREWTIPGLRTKRKAWGFTLTVDGKRKRYQSGDQGRVLQPAARVEQARLLVRLPRGARSGDKRSSARPAQSAPPCERERHPEEGGALAS